MKADDLGDEVSTRCWPHFCIIARTFDVRSTMSIALPWTEQLVCAAPGSTAVGAINLYATEPQAFAGPEGRALLLGTWAGSLLTHGIPTA